MVERQPPQMTFYEKPPNAKMPTSLDFEVELDQPNSKKKKEKKKKKQKGAVINEIPLPVQVPRGLIAPLEPPKMGLGPKLAAGDHLTPKPSPWENPSLGLRKGPPPTGPQPPRRPPPGPYGLQSHLGSPRDRPDSQELYDQSDFDSDVVYGRPITPEPPPHTQRDLMGRSFQPAPPGMGHAGNSHSNYRGPIEGRPFGRDAFYGPSGAMHGPLAHANGQALLRNTDMGRGAMMKVDSRAQGMNRAKGPQGFALHSGVQSPHPPLR